MRVQMLETRRAAPDGVDIVELRKGKTYELPDELAEKYLGRGLAKEAGANATVDEPPVPEVTEEKSAGGSPETTSQEGAPENKTEPPAAAKEEPKPPAKRARRSRAARKPAEKKATSGAPETK